MSKSIRELSQMDGRVYVYLRTTEISEKFLEEAEKEGFTFCDGLKPTERKAETIMAVNPDLTLNYVGTNGRIAFGSGAKRIGSQKLIRIDYDRLLVDEPLSTKTQLNANKFNKKVE